MWCRQVELVGLIRQSVPAPPKGESPLPSQATAARVDTRQQRRRRRTEADAPYQARRPRSTRGRASAPGRETGAAAAPAEAPAPPQQRMMAGPPGLPPGFANMMAGLPFPPFGAFGGGE